MMFRIEYTPEAVSHLAALSRRQAIMVVDQVERKLKHQPTFHPGIGSCFARTRWRRGSFV